MLKDFIIRKFVKKKNPSLHAAKLFAKFSTSILTETGAAGLYGRFARRKFFVSAKNK